MPSFRRVILESPFAGNTYLHSRYARACVRDCILRGDAPMASHLLYTQTGILHDNNPEERTLGIDAGHAWIPAAEAVVVYTDHGISPGMQIGIDRALAARIPIEYRRLSHLDMVTSAS